MSARRLPTALRVTAAGYEPVDEDGATQHAKLKPGSIVGAQIARSRSLPQHRRYWSVLASVVTHCPGNWRTPEALHEALKVATGHVEICRLVDGRLIKIPESTAFDAMNQDLWAEYHDAAMHIIEDEILQGMSVDELLTHTDASRARRDSNAIEAMLAAGNMGG